MVPPFSLAKRCYVPIPDNESLEVRVLVTRIGLLAIVISAATLTAPAKAQDDIRKRGDRACGASAHKFCSKFFEQGGMAVLGCLQRNKARLDGRCRKFLTEIGQLQ